MYKLYYSPSTASMAVHWMLIELAVPFELVLVDIAAKAQKSPEFLRINPSGHVPVLVIDGVPYAECAALLMLLAERHPAAGLSPAVGSAGAQRVCPDDVLSRQHAPAGVPAVVLSGRSGWSRQHRGGEGTGARQDRAGLVAASMHSLGTGAHSSSETGSPAADFLATILMRWSRNMPRPATTFPNLAAYIGRMRATPSLRDVHFREKLTDWIDG